MAVKKGIYKIKKDDGTYDEIHLRTDANQVIENDNRKFVTNAEKTTWNGKANANHEHNYIRSRGKVAMETGNQALATSGISLSEAYNNGYPVTYGNVLNVKGGGTGQLLMEWGGNTSTACGRLFYRSKSDVHTTAYSDWCQVYTSTNKPTAQDIGAAASSHGHDSVYIKYDKKGTDYPGIIINGSDTLWLRTSTQGLLPHSSNSTSSLGTSSWKFSEAHVKKIYEDGLLLSEKYAAKSHSHSYLALNGGTLTGKIVLSSHGMEIPTKGNSWITGKTATTLLNFTGSSGSTYHPMIRYEMHNGDVANIGAYRNHFGFYGYKAGRTENGTDCSAYLDIENNKFVATKFSGNGSELTGVNAASLNGQTESTTASGNKIARRDGNGDVHVRCIRSEYQNQSSINGGIAFRTNNSSDNYIKFCNDVTSIRNFLNVYSKTDVYTRTESDNKYMQKSNSVFSGDITITTPAT